MNTHTLEDRVRRMVLRRSAWLIVAASRRNWPAAKWAVQELAGTATRLYLKLRLRAYARTGIDYIDSPGMTPTLAEPHPEKYSFMAAVNGEYPALCDDPDCEPCKASAESRAAEDEAADRAWEDWL